MHYQDFELEISRNDDKGDYIAKVRSPQGEAEEIFALPDAVTLENLVLKMRGVSRSTRLANSTEVKAAIDLGKLLFENAFGGEISNLLKSCLDQSSTENGLRIKLILQDAPELSALPWEFLYLPKRRDFLAHSPETPIVRYLQHATAIKPLEVTPPLKLLVAIASPSDVSLLDTVKERRELEQALAPLENEGELQATWIEHATIAKLAAALEESSFHLFHFIGHSYFNEEHGEGALILEDEYGRSDHYEAARLKVLLHDHHTLRLVVLNSCEGAKQDEQDPFSSIATTLMLAGIPAVIAMQFNISDQAAISFSKVFYKWLAKGATIDKAVGEARKHLFVVDKNNVEWGTPVLYLRAKDGVLFAVDKGKEKTTQEKLEQEKTAKEKVTQTKLEQEKAAQAEVVQEKLEQEKSTQEIPKRKKAVQEKLEQKNKWRKYAMLFMFFCIVAFAVFMYYSKQQNYKEQQSIAKQMEVERQRNIAKIEVEKLKADKAKAIQEQLESDLLGLDKTKQLLALPNCIKLAESGSIEMMYALGVYYYFKVSNYPEGCRWLKKSAEKGNQEAENKYEQATHCQ